MIIYVKGDLLESDAQTLVNTVNCFGVMGKGIALEFRKKYPEMFKQYKEMCNAGEVKIGKLHLFKTSDKWIVNFPTKNHWRFPSKLEYIEKGLQFFMEHYKEWGIESIAFPKLGSNHGKLNWNDVKAVIEKYLSGLDIQIQVYEEYVPSDILPVKRKKLKRTISKDQLALNI